MSRYFKDPASGKVIIAKNATQPKMSKPTWDRNSFWVLHPDTPITTPTGVTIDIDARQQRVRGYYESQWGKYLYFELDGHWYKIHVRTHDDTAPPFSSVRKDYPANFDLSSLKPVEKAVWDEFRVESP